MAPPVRPRLPLAGTVDPPPSNKGTFISLSPTRIRFFRVRLFWICIFLSSKFFAQK